MSDSQKPVLVFVPGGWHTPASFEPTSSLLSKEGYQTIGVSLPTIGSELRNVAPPQDWDEDVKAIREVLVKQVEQGKDVVLIVHSYGGTVGSEACRNLSKVKRESEGLSGGVVKLVYLAALVLDVGHYIWEPTGGKPFDVERTIMKGDLCYTADTVPWFYNKCSPESQEELPKSLKSHAWKAFLSKVTYTAWRDIPGVYLMAENDHALTPAITKGMLDAALGHRFEIETCDGDHSPFASRPELTAKVIRRAAGESI